VHDRQGDQSSDGTVGGRGKDKERLDGVVELDKKREIDANERDQKYDGQVEKTIDLLRLFASNFELVSRRQILIEII